VRRLVRRDTVRCGRRARARRRRVTSGRVLGQQAQGEAEAEEAEEEEEEEEEEVVAEEEVLEDEEEVVEQGKEGGGGARGPRMRLGRNIEAQLWLLAAAFAVTRTARSPAEGLLGMEFDDETGEELLKALMPSDNSILTDLEKLAELPDTTIVLIGEKHAHTSRKEPLVVYQTGVSTQYRARSIADRTFTFTPSSPPPDIHHAHRHARTHARTARHLDRERRRRRRPPPIRLDAITGCGGGTALLTGAAGVRAPPKQTSDSDSETSTCSPPRAPSPEPRAATVTAVERISWFLSERKYAGGACVAGRATDSGKSGAMPGDGCRWERHFRNVIT
jgi:hypothetical protein